MTLVLVAVGASSKSAVPLPPEAWPVKESPHRHCLSDSSEIWLTIEAREGPGLAKAGHPASDLN
jgi:hypothetical protein